VSAIAIAMTIAAGAALLAAPTAAATMPGPGPRPGPVPNSDRSWSPAGGAGWSRTFLDSFTGPIDTTVWGRYHGRSRSSTISNWARDNVATTPYTGSGGRGHLLIRTTNTNGTWTSGGLSSGRGVARTQGQWLVRAKIDRAPGIGYAFLLYPQGGGWPPEIDFAEGTAGDTPTIMATLHYGADNRTVSNYLHDRDITQWHTFGVIINGDTVDYTIDGIVWSTVRHHGVPRVPLWLGIQTNVKPNDGTNSEWLTTATPHESQIDIDWVAHYTYHG